MEEPQQGTRTVASMAITLVVATDIFIAWPFGVVLPEWLMWFPTVALLLIIGGEILLVTNPASPRAFGALLAGIASILLGARASGAI